MESDERLPEPVRGWTLFLLRKSAQLVGDAVDAELEGDGVTARHIGVLSVIANTPGLNQAVLGARMRIDRTTVVALVDHLEANGWVERRAGAEDRRTRELHLTAAGARRVTALRAKLLAAQDAAVGGLTASERRTLNGLLAKLLEAAS